MEAVEAPDAGAQAAVEVAGADVMDVEEASYRRGL